eukprot:TRINITY_DN16804_c0_g1_i1.p1 TRINITY_DN16804_c0_g1~~TRINITY_DN16804_c0_g1_i1.p1  ORF type:complete len:392 (+),score=98.83 TRINITY_DN16804_c0_g1_i1:40-1176(+)
MAGRALLVCAACGVAQCAQPLVQCTPPPQPQSCPYDDGMPRNWPALMSDAELTELRGQERGDDCADVDVPVFSPQGGEVCRLPRRLSQWIDYDLSRWAGRRYDALRAITDTRFSSGVFFAIWNGSAVRHVRQRSRGRRYSGDGNARFFMASLDRIAHALPTKPALLVVTELDLPRAPAADAGADCADIRSAHGAGAVTEGAPSDVPTFSACTLPTCFTDILFPSVGNADGAAAPAASGWEDKRDAVFWRGSLHGQGLGSAGDRDAVGVAEVRPGVPRNHRLRAVLSARAAAASISPTTVDVGFVDRAGKLETVPSNVAAPATQMADMVEHRYLLDVDGMGWTGRTSRLMAANATVVFGGIFQDVYHRTLAAARRCCAD